MSLSGVVENADLIEAIGGEGAERRQICGGMVHAWHGGLAGLGRGNAGPFSNQRSVGNSRADAAIFGLGCIGLVGARVHAVVVEASAETRTVLAIAAWNHG